jgi:hypothetical protein
MKTVLLFIGLSASSVLTAHVPPLDADGNQSTPGFAGGALGYSVSRFAVLLP